MDLVRAFVALCGMVQDLMGPETRAVSSPAAHLSPRVGLILTKFDD